MTDLVEIIGSAELVVCRDGETRELGRMVADAVVRLVRDGHKLGELEAFTFTRPTGEAAHGRRMPLGWLSRLERAVEVGAFERLNVREIVARILLPQGARS